VAGAVHVTVTDGVDCRWVDVVARDRHGLLAATTGALANLDLEISHAVVATWPDDAALESFCVHSDELPDVEELRHAIEAGLAGDLGSPPLPEATVVFDDHASPWHTACEIEAPDKPHLLHQLATAFAAAGADVVSAAIAGRDDRAYDTFLLDGADGNKLDAADKAAIVGFIQGGVVTRQRRWRRPAYSIAQPEPAEPNGAAAVDDLART
jgi:UTP:GlnB (protein PII) uridylyltransferase